VVLRRPSVPVRGGLLDGANVRVLGEVGRNKRCARCGRVMKKARWSVLHRGLYMEGWLCKRCREHLEYCDSTRVRTRLIDAKYPQEQTLLDLG